MSTRGRVELLRSPVEGYASRTEGAKFTGGRLITFLGQRRRSHQRDMDDGSYDLPPAVTFLPHEIIRISMSGTIMTCTAPSGDSTRGGALGGTTHGDGGTGI